MDHGLARGTGPFLPEGRGARFMAKAPPLVKPHSSFWTFTKLRALSAAPAQAATIAPRKKNHM